MDSQYEPLIILAVVAIIVIVVIIFVNEYGSKSGFGVNPPRSQQSSSQSSPSQTQSQQQSQQTQASSEEGVDPQSQRFINKDYVINDHLNLIPYQRINPFWDMRDPAGWIVSQC